MGAGAGSGLADAVNAATESELKTAIEGMDWKTVQCKICIYIYIRTLVYIDCYIYSIFVQRACGRHTASTPASRFKNTSKTHKNTYKSPHLLTLRPLGPSKHQKHTKTHKNTRKTHKFTQKYTQSIVKTHKNTQKHTKKRAKTHKNSARRAG